MVQCFYPTPWSLGEGNTLLPQCKTLNIREELTKARNQNSVNCIDEWRSWQLPIVSSLKVTATGSRLDHRQERRSSSDGIQATPIVFRPTRIWARRSFRLAEVSHPQNTHRRLTSSKTYFAASTCVHCNLRKATRTLFTFGSASRSVSACW